MGIADQLCVSKACASGYCSIDVVEVFPGSGDHGVRLTTAGEGLAKKILAGHRPFGRMLLDAEMGAKVVSREVRRAEHCIPADFPESPSSCLERIKDSLRQGISIAGRPAPSSSPMRSRLMQRTAREAVSPARTWRTRG